MTMFLKPLVIAATALPIAMTLAALASRAGASSHVAFAHTQPEKPVTPKPTEKPATKPTSPPEAKPKPVDAPPQPATKPSDSPSPTKPPEPPQPTKPDETLPNLDELLGIPGQPRAGDSSVPDPSKMDLDRMLTGEEIGDAFKEAVTLMGDAAKRLKDGKDASLTTQRLQESIVRRLDQLLSSLDQQQQQQQSSSSQQQQQNQDKKQSQNVPSQQQNERKEEGKNENDGTATTPPGRKDGALRPGLDAVRSSWGMLPERVRDMLVQGSNDTFSSMYEKMTEAYYKKLAEQGKAK